jgi:methylthioribulose-1-phosphate dehydratase
MAEPDEEVVRAAGATLAAESARFASFGWMRGTSGNLSQVLSRDPLRLAVTASGVDKGEMRPDDVVVVDADGQAVPGNGAGATRPSAEAALHARVASVTGAGAVVHVHTVAAVAAGRRWPGGVELEGVEMLKGIGVAAEGERVTVPVIANSQDMRVLGDRLERARHPRVPAVIIADHGLYAWGADPQQARHHTEIVEWLLELHLATG